MWPSNSVPLNLVGLWGKRSANEQYGYNPSNYGFMADVPHEMNNSMMSTKKMTKVCGKNQYKET